MPNRLEAIRTLSPLPDHDEWSEGGDGIGGCLHPYPYCVVPSGPWSSFPPEFDALGSLQSLLTIESFDGRTVMEFARR